jgi:hypothetical protein
MMAILNARKLHCEDCATMKKSHVIIVSVAALIAIALRLVDRPTLNFSALGALALFCGAVVRPGWLGLAVVLGCRLITDVVLQMKTGYGFYGSMAFDYAAYMAVFALGTLVSSRHWGQIVGGALGAALTFFVVSNLGVWLMEHGGTRLYPLTLSGLVECYTNAIPFARGTFTGDILFSLLFFGSLHLVRAFSDKKSPVLAANER